MIHLNACKIEKFRIWNFSHLLASTNFFSFTWVKYGWAQGTQHTKYMPYPLPEYLFTDEDQIEVRLNASLLDAQEICGRVLKWTQLSQVPGECLNQTLTLPYHTLFLFLSKIFSKHFFCLVRRGQWSQLVASTTEFHPLGFLSFIFFPLYIAYMLSCSLCISSFSQIPPYCAEGDSFRSTIFCYFWPVGCCTPLFSPCPIVSQPLLTQSPSAFIDQLPYFH